MGRNPQADEVEPYPPDMSWDEVDLIIREQDQELEIEPLDTEDYLRFS